MLLDEFLPVSNFNEIHTIVIQSSPSRVFQAIKDVTIAELPVFRFLFGLRLMPARLARKRLRPFEKNQPLLGWAERLGLLLAESADQELVFGITGQFWKLWGGAPPSIKDAREYLAFQKPGYAKAATNFYLSQGEKAGGTRLSTETRIQALDSTAHKKFGVYWWFIHPGSALIRREWLRAIKSRAEGS